MLFEWACAFLANTRVFSFRLFAVLRGVSRASESMTEACCVQDDVQAPEARSCARMGHVTCHWGWGRGGRVLTLRERR